MVLATAIVHRSVEMLLLLALLLLLVVLLLLVPQLSHGWLVLLLLLATAIVRRSVGMEVLLLVLRLLLVLCGVSGSGGAALQGGQGRVAVRA